MLIAAIGDSLTYGFPYSPEHSWLEAVKKQLGVSTLNQGICGETTGEMLYRFQTDVIAQHPDMVIIMGGSNDAFSGIIAAEVVQNIRLMADRAIQNGIKPVICLPIPCSYPQEEALLQEYRKSIVSYCGANGITVIDFYKPLVDARGFLKTELQIDGVHPNLSGYAIMSQTAVPILQSVIEPKQS